MFTICPYLTVLAFLSICVCGNQTYAETDDPSITTNFYDPRYHDYGRNHLRDTKPLISDATITGSSNKIRIFQNVANSGSYTPSSSSIKTNIDNYYGPNRKIKMRFTNPTLMEKQEIVRSPHSAKYNYEDYYPHQNFHYPLRQSFQGFSLPYLYKSTKTIPKTDIPRYSHGFSTIYPAYSYGEENWYNPELKDSDSASKDLFSNSNPLNLIYKGPILPSHPKKSTPVIKSSYYTDLSPYIAGYPSGFSKGYFSVQSSPGPHSASTTRAGYSLSSLYEPLTDVDVSNRNLNFQYVPTLKNSYFINGENQVSTPNFEPSSSYTMPYGLHRKNYISPPKTFFRSYTTPIMSSRYLPYRPQSIIPAPHQQTEERNSGNLLSNCSPEILPWYKTRGGSWARQPQIIPMARYYKYKYSTISHSNIDMHPFEYENGPSEKSYK